MHLDNLETRGEPTLSFLHGERRPHVIMPPLAVAAPVAVAETGELAVVGDGRHRVKTGALQMGVDVTTPDLQRLLVIGHCLTEDREHLVHSFGQVLRCPGDESHATSTSSAPVIRNNSG